MDRLSRALDNSSKELVKILGQKENADLRKALMAYPTNASAGAFSSHGRSPSEGLYTRQEWKEYLAEHTEASGISMEQAARFEAIVNGLDDGWSGSAYWWVFKTAQRNLIQGN